MLRSHRRRRLLLALLATTSASAVPVASADASPLTLTHHDVTVEGEYSYSISARHTAKGYAETTDLTTKGKLVGTGQLDFAYDAEGTPQPVAQQRADLDYRTEASGSWRHWSKDEFSEPYELNCSIGASPQGVSGYVERSLLQPLTGSDVGMTFRLAKALPISFEGPNCAGRGPVLGSDALAEMGRFDADFTLPREAVTAGKTIQLVDGPKTEPCPGSEAPDVTSCKLTWKATITLVKRGSTTIGDGDEEPTPSTSTSAPAPTPTTSTPAPPPAPVDTSRSEQNMVDAVSKAVEEYLHPSPGADDAKVDAVSRAVREYLQSSEAGVSPSRAEVDVQLPAGSKGSLSATAIAERNATAGIKLGSAYLFPEMATRAAPGAQALSRMTARVRFDAADRRVLKRKRFVALTLRVTVPGVAKPVVVRKVVRVKR